ncbi:MAG: hypothetical protein ACTSX4_00650 [Candidatus Helarchaeota archaeon]
MTPQDLKSLKKELKIMLGFFSFFCFVHITSIWSILLNSSQYVTVQVPFLFATILFPFGIVKVIMLLKNNTFSSSSSGDLELLMKEINHVKIFFAVNILFSFLFFIQLPFCILIPQMIEGGSIYFEQFTPLREVAFVITLIIAVLIGSIFVIRKSKNE